MEKNISRAVETYGGTVHDLSMIGDSKETGIPDFHGAADNIVPYDTGHPRRDTTPDSPVATKVKQLLVEEFELSPDAVTNEAELRQDLDLYDLERLDLLAAWTNAFDIDYRILDEVMRPDGKGTDILFRVRTVGELIALTEWILREKIWCKP